MDSQCNNGLFCDGAETCVANACQAGINPCQPGETCDEAMDTCMAPPQCTVDADCDNNMFCDGAETCVGEACQPGAPPCDPATETCDEASDVCEPIVVGCLTDSDCDDGMFCNGAETCDVATAECMPGMVPCAAGEPCDEAADMCMPPGEKTGCVFNPPPGHTDCEDGCRHAPGKEKPYTNGCTLCHGVDLMGASAPSCFTCHGPEWDQKAPNADGCFFSPPPNHTDKEDGCLHAPGKEKPFTNGCTDCHGANLMGGPNNRPPSCFTCHGPEWEQKPMGGRGCISSDMLPTFHKDSEDGCLHAPGKEKPFTNGCTGCHGADLLGGIGPSCLTCHGPEWDEMRVGMGCKDDEERDDDDKSEDENKRRR